MELVIGAAFIGAIFMGISIGASSVAPAFGPVNSSGSINVLRASLLAGVFAFLGSVLQGSNVANTIGSGILKGGIGLHQASAVLIVASFLVIVSVLTDYPMPTAFTVVGAVLGSAFSFGNTVSIPVMAKIVAYWLLVPLAAAALGFLMAKLFRRFLSKENNRKEIRWLLLGSGCYMAYTAGAGSVGLAVGPLSSLDVSSGFLLAFGGLAILAGSWIYSPRIIKAVSYDYSNIGPRRSIAALFSAAFLAQVGIFFGVPISFNEAIIASVIGSGLVEGKGNTERAKILWTAGAWTGAFLLSGILTYAIGIML